jgi:hypothetical protein
LPECSISLWTHLDEQQWKDSFPAASGDERRTEQVSQTLLGTDIGGHCSIWGDWPIK